MMCVDVALLSALPPSAATSFIPYVTQLSGQSWYSLKIEDLSKLLDNQSNLLFFFEKIWYWQLKYSSHFSSLQTIHMTTHQKALDFSNVSIKMWIAIENGSPCLSPWLYSAQPKKVSRILENVTQFDWVKAWDGGTLVIERGLVEMVWLLHTSTIRKAKRGCRCWPPQNWEAVLSSC